MEREKVKLSSSMWLGGADCMIATLCNIMTGGGLTFFFVNYFKMSPALSGVCWMIFALWNAVNDPLFGYISDKTKSKLGRRIPYIRYGALAIATIFVLSWVLWFGNGSDMQMFAQMLISLFIFDTLYTAIATSLYVMPFEMAVTNEARGKILFVKVIFSLVSLAVPLVLLAELEKILNNSLETYQMIMTIIGVVAGVVVFASTFFYKENGYAKEETQYPFFRSLKICFTNKSFLVFEIVSFSITYIQTALMLGLSYYFEAFSINFLWCYLAMFVGIIAGMVIFTKSAVSWGVKKSIVFMCAVFGGGMLLLLLTGQFLVGGIIGFFCAGIGFTGGMYMIPLMNGDVIDYDEHTSGLRREGMYAGVNSFICKPAISIANTVFPIMLVWFGYNADIAIAMQTQRAKFGILFSWLIVPVVLLFICAVCIKKFYPLHGKKWQEIKDSLTQVHAKKQAEYEEEMLSKNING